MPEEQFGSSGNDLMNTSNLSKDDSRIETGLVFADEIKSCDPLSSQHEDGGLRTISIDKIKPSSSCKANLLTPENSKAPLNRIKKEEIICRKSTNLLGKRKIPVQSTFSMLEVPEVKNVEN